MTYMFATLNSRSAPMTMMQKAGKANAQYELEYRLTASRRNAMKYEAVPMYISNLLDTRCNMNAAMMLTVRPIMHIGSK